MALDIRGVCPYFEVYDMPASLRFYIDQLGFSMIGHSPHLGGDPYRYHWVWLRLGTAEVMLNTCYEFEDERPTREEHLRLRQHRDACLFFGCPDVDAAYAELTARGVVVDRPPKVAAYGMKQMYLKDPDGFGLCFQWQVEQ
ncbi:MAG TPA: VOC family protein [Acidobacteriaceae bacterium]|nr:VOC family protein [Acidobacteriaceae bacterium]